MALVSRALLLLLAARSVAGSGSAAGVAEADGQCAIQIARHAAGTGDTPAMAGKPGAEQARQALQSHTCQGLKVWSDLPCSESCQDFCSGHSMSCVDAWWSSGEDVCMLSLSAKCGDLAGSPWNDNDNLVCQCGSASANKKPPAPKVVEPEAEEAGHELKGSTCQGVKVWSGLPCSESCHDFCSGRSMSCVDAWWSSGEDVCMFAVQAKCGDLAGSPWHEEDNLVCQCGGGSNNEKPRALKTVKPEAKDASHDELKGHICQGVKVWSDLPCSESCHDFCSGRSMSCVDAWWSSGEDVCMLAVPAKCGDLAGSPWHEEDNLVCQCSGVSEEENPPASKAVETRAGEANIELNSHLCWGLGLTVWSDLPCSESCHDVCSSRSMSCEDAWWSAGEDVCMLSEYAECGDLPCAPRPEGYVLACLCDEAGVLAGAPWLEEEPQAPKVPEPEAEEARQAVKSQICQDDVKVVTDLHCSESCHSYCSGYDMKCVEVWWSSGEDLCNAALPAKCGDMAGAPVNEGDALVCQCGFAAA